jgi:hypothetical protein
MRYAPIALLVPFLGAACADDPAPVSEPLVETRPPDPPPAVRVLVEKKPTSTPPQNLVVDPDFQSLWTQLDETGFGLYEAFVYDESGEVPGGGARFLAQTPAGPSASVLSVTPRKEATLTMTVRGGKGPLTASVWVSTKDSKTLPEVSVVSLYDSSAIVLRPDDATHRDEGGLSWVQWRGTTTEALPGQLYFTATVTSSVSFVAPQVMSEALASTRSNSAPSRASAASLRAARRFETWRAKHFTMLPPRMKPAPRR